MQKQKEYVEYTILMHSENVVPNSKNSKLIYRFDNPVTFKDAHISINQISLFKSWFNIREVNNTFTYYFLDENDELVPYTMTIDPGAYKVNDLQEAIESVLQTRKHFWLDSSNKYYYPIRIITNYVYYSIQLIVVPIPALGAGYTKPSGATWFMQAGPTGLQVVISSSNTFGELIGYKPGSYPSTVQTTTFSALSNITPRMSGGIESLILRCNLVDMGQYSYPSDLCYIIGTSGISNGDQVLSTAPKDNWLPIKNGQYNNIQFTLSNVDLSTVDIKDPGIIISFKVRQPKEI
jgi:hypothetical protein